MQEEYNNIFNQILMDLLKSTYAVYGSSDMSTSLDVTLAFGEDRKIVLIKDLKVNNSLKAPTSELVELVNKLNEISQKLLELPEIYRLKECHFIVSAGGKIDMTPVYIKQ